MSVLDQERPPVLARAPTRTVHDWITDSRHWERYAPRKGDVIIATAPKVGTTWTQQIVRLLVMQDPAPVSLGALSPWLDARFQMPLEVAIPLIEAQTHRRFLKTHLPFDALPIYDEVQYVHVVRDGRDSAMSFCNHFASFTPEIVARFDEIGLSDEAIGRAFPRAPLEPRAFFRQWLERRENIGALMSLAGFIDIEQTYWSERGRKNLLLVHYNDLKADLDGEMRRIAGFLGIEPAPDVWPKLVQAATFEQMKADGDTLLAGMEVAFVGGHRSFLHKGTNGRWRDVLTEEDLRDYDARIAEALTPGLRAWIEHGRQAFGDPSQAPD